MGRKKYDYQPMNAIEFFLHEIARNTEEMVEILKSTNEPVKYEAELKAIADVIKVEEKKEEIKVEEVKVDEKKPAPKRKPRAKKVADA